MPSNLQRIVNTANKAGLDGFILSLAAAILLAYFLPEPGVYEGTFSLKNLANYGISFIFFFYGLRLSLPKLKAGLSNWPLHILIHAITFVLFPLLILAAKAIFHTEAKEWLWLGIFFLAALPSTVSSAVVMVSIAKGNIPAAIFNASISSLLGIFITPLWMGLVLTAETGNLDASNIILKLIIQVLFPVTLGILLAKYGGTLAENNKKYLRYFDQLVILVIVYTSFSTSFSEGFFEELAVTDLLVLVIAMAVLFFLIFGVVSLVSYGLKFNRQDTITAVFCASKKSLVHGSVMAKVIFANTAFVGVILLPVMLYHAIQLIAASIIAQSMARKAPSIGK